MTDRVLPLVILAGSDRAAHQLPEDSSDLHPLTGVKGFDLQHRGRPLIDSVVELFLSCRAFGPCYVAGPASVYGQDRPGAEVIDTDGSFGENLRTSLEYLSERHPNSPVAVTTCDVLPDRDELLAVLQDYEEHAPLDFWFPLILAPSDPGELGASSWKPRYRIPPVRGETAREILPGHLLIIELRALRSKLVFCACDAAYESRNHSIIYRLFYISGRLLTFLFLHDLNRLFHFKIPVATFEVLWNGLMVALRLRRGSLSEVELAQRLRNAFTASRHRREHHDRLGRMPGLPGLSLAKDIDTFEEAVDLLGNERKPPASK